MIVEPLWSQHKVSFESYFKPTQKGIRYHKSDSMCTRCWSYIERKEKNKTKEYRISLYFQS